jgi:hypothetical protein
MYLSLQVTIFTLAVIQLPKSVHLINNKYALFVALKEAVYHFPCLA